MKQSIRISALVAAVSVGLASTGWAADGTDATDTNNQPSLAGNQAIFADATADEDATVGGAGGDATATATADTTGGTLSVAATSQAGTGGIGAGTNSAGAGGSAVSTAVATTNSNHNANATASSAGGTGGMVDNPEVTAQTGAGGNANSTANATAGGTANAMAFATATGGGVGDYFSPPAANGGGVATAFTNAFGAGANSNFVSARSFAIGGFGAVDGNNGTAEAGAYAASTTSVMSVQTTAFLPGALHDGNFLDTSATAHSTVNGFVDLPEAAGSFTVAIGSVNPTEDSFSSYFTGPVAAAFDNNIDQVAGIGALSLFAPVATGGTISAHADFNLDPASLTGDTLKVIFFDADGSVSELSTLTFELSVEGVSQFITPTAGSPSLFELAIPAAGGNNAVDVLVRLSLTGGAAEDTFSGKFFIGTSSATAVPEPTTLTAVSVAAAGLLLRRRRNA